MAGSRPVAANAYRPVGTRAWSSENQCGLRDGHPLEQFLEPVQHDDQVER